jgi:hypothetical protein
MLLIVNNIKSQWFVVLCGVMSKHIITQMDVKTLFKVSFCMVLCSMSGNLTKYFVTNHHRVNFNNEYQVRSSVFQRSYY